MKGIINASVVMPDGRIENGLSILFDQKIVKVGKDILFPENTKITDAKGNYVTTGLIDCHSHIGITEDGAGGEFHSVNEMTNPVTPEIRAIDGFNTRDRALYEALKSGVTTVGIFPGSANLIGGQGAALKTAAKGRLISDILLNPFMGLKMALGENPISVYKSQNKSPSTRMAEIAMIREAFYAAEDYISSKGLNKKDTPFNRNLGFEAISKTFDGTVPVCIHAHRSQDIEAAVRLSKELGFRLILQHASESHRVLDLLAENNISCVVGPTFNFRTKVETREKTFQSLNLLHKNNIPFSITLDHPVVPLWLLNVAAGFAVRDGLPEKEAFKAITSSPATFLGLEDKVGKIAKGFDADIVIWDGFPLQSMSKTLHVYVDGEIVYNRELDTKPDWEWYS